MTVNNQPRYAITVSRVLAGIACLIFVLAAFGHGAIFGLNSVPLGGAFLSAAFVF